MSINTISYEVDNETNRVLYSKEIDKILIKDINDLKSDQKILFIYDKNISKKFIDDFKTKLKLTGNIVFFKEIEGKKVNKNLNNLLKLFDELIRNKFTKNSIIISCGGGVVGDLCGLLSSLYLRGTIYFHIPTTMTAIVDSCIGGKTGINYKVKNFIYASTSSVYGVQKKFPLKENFDTNHPIQLYAATKKSNELIANVYNHLFKLNTIGLRFFTVYGPWGRPDMALFKFTKNIIDGKKIEVFNHGKHIRDFTYVDDVINIIYKIISKNSKIKRSNNSSKIYNVGNGKKIKLKEYIDIIEKNLKKKSKKKFLSLQKGDVIKTHCDNRLLKREYNCAPKINVEQGVKKFLQWYTSYYKKNKKLI